MTDKEKEQVVEALMMSNSVIKSLINITPVEKLSAFMSIQISANIEIINELNKN